MQFNPILALLFLGLPLGTLLAQQNRELPRVKLIGTGGTIAHVPATAERPDYYVNPDTVLGDIRQHVEGVATVEVEELFRKAGQNLTMEDYLAVARRVNAIFREDPEIAGVVVSIGSNGVEELAYFLSLTVHSEKPVVLTAANRLYTSLSSDSPMNLLDAIRVAASPQAQGQEAMAVLNGKINAPGASPKWIPSWTIISRATSACWVTWTAILCSTGGRCGSTRASRNSTSRSSTPFPRST